MANPAAVNQLKSLARQVTVLTRSMYDQNLQDPLLNAIAAVFPARGRAKTQTIEWGEVFPQMNEWVGDRKTQSAFSESIEITMAAFEITYLLDRMDLDLDGDLSLLPDIATVANFFANGWSTGRVIKAIGPTRDNMTTYDGQAMYSASHTHPNGETFSNLIDLSAVSASRTSAAAPTVAEAKTELKLLTSALVSNRLVVQEVVEVTDVPLVVVVKSDAVWQAYEDLRTDEQVGGEPNRFRGKFRLIRDYNPASGTSSTVDGILADPGGPRPSIFVPGKTPGAVEVDESKLFGSRQIPFGQDAIYGFAAGFPQATARITD